MKKNITFLLFIFFSFSSVFADTPHYLDFKSILNESNAGKETQTFLKKKLENGFKNINEKEKKILDEEKKLIQQKKILSADEYKNKVSDLRKKVSALQKEKNDIIQSVNKQKNKARDVLLKSLNPIVKNYMKEKKIRIVIDKKSILLADENLDITKDIMNQLNKELKSIKLN